MTNRFLIAALALATILGGQQAVAKSHKSTTKTSANKKHHKKHMKKTATAKAAASTAEMAS